MRAILFDIDGTLIRTHGAGRAALSSAFTQVFDRVDEHEIDTRGRTDRAIVRDLFLAHGVEDSPENWRQLTAAYLEHLPRMLHERGGHVLPGVAELLAMLGERDDLHVGLLTGNTAGGARLKLAHFNLHERFAFGGYGDVHFDRNAVAAAAHAELRRHSGREISTDNIWVIGDTPHDVTCARHIGAKVIAVATGQHAREELEAEQPDVLLDDLGDFIAVRRALLL
jgi:phosphoglycolate phosphatase-like HAD superfamily hydrolase